MRSIGPKSSLNGRRSETGLRVPGALFRNFGAIRSEHLGMFQYDCQADPRETADPATGKQHQRPEVEPGKAEGAEWRLLWKVICPIYIFVTGV